VKGSKQHGCWFSLAMMGSFMEQCFIFFFFFFLGGVGESIVFCSQSGDDPHEDLAKFFYKLKYECNFKKILLLCWLLTWTLYRNMKIFHKLWSNSSIENLKKHMISVLLLLNISFCLYLFCSQKKLALK
jgi:hypothetical protein